jgi:hypothetical protein
MYLRAKAGRFRELAGALHGSISAELLNLAAEMESVAAEMESGLGRPGGRCRGDASAACHEKSVG